MEIIRSYIQDGIGLIQIGAVLVVGWVVLTAWMTTRSITKVLGAMLIGALVLGFIYRADWFGTKAAEDIQNRDNGMEVLP